MILSAGYGTRLKPITDRIPKALVVYKSKPLINNQIERLVKAGIDEIVINAHHFSDKISEYIKSRTFRIKINVIVEEQILGTGGGILNAKKYFEKEKSFLVINVDVDTDSDLGDIINYHNENDWFATIAVQNRKTTRYIEFSNEMILCGRVNEKSPGKNLFAFNGIHIISGEIFSQGLEIKYIDIFDLYSELIKKGKIIKGFDMGNSFFKDIGKMENLI
jgi:NDP-sugar pyrophosphorylase family protein